MVGQQLRAWDVLDGRVLDVMEALPRERFVPPEWRGLAYADAEIPLGAGKLLAPPKLQGRALQALLPQPDDNVLEIGAGTGYMTACLALLTHSVTAVELHPELAAAARSNLAALDIRNADVVEGDALAMEFPPEFDVICVNGSLPVAEPRLARLLRAAVCRGRHAAADGGAAGDAPWRRRLDDRKTVRDLPAATGKRAAAGGVRILMIKEMSPAEFVARRDQGETPVLLDVREDWELGIARIDGAVHIPMGEIPARLGELAPERELVVLCRSGGRSAQVARYLAQQGFSSVWNLAGGILAWAQQVDPTLTPY